MLVREGWADVREIRASDAENVDVEALYSYKAEAQAAKRGIWADSASVSFCFVGWRQWEVCWRSIGGELEMIGDLLEAKWDIVFSQDQQRRRRIKRTHTTRFCCFSLYL